MRFLTVPGSRGHPFSRPERITEHGVRVPLRLRRNRGGGS